MKVFSVINDEMMWCYFFCRISCSILLSKIYSCKDKMYIEERKKNPLKLCEKLNDYKCIASIEPNFLACISCL